MDSNEVKLHFLDYWRVVRVRWGLISLVFFMVLVSAGVTVTFLPKEYFAKVSMEVRPDDSKFNPLTGANGSYYNAQFVATQFQLLRKSEILYDVIDNLGLVKTFSGEGQLLPKQQVFNMLLNQLEIQEVRNTSLIEVGVWNTDAQLSADIANYIAVVYRNKRLQDLQVGLERSLSQFQDEVTKQRKIVLDAAQEMARIRDRDGVNDPDPDSAGVPVTAALGKQTQTAEQALAESRIRVAKLKTTIASIKDLKPQELLSALKSLDIQDPTVTQKLPELQTAVVKEAELLNNGVGERHRAVQSLRATKQALNGILADALETIRRTEAIQLRFEEDNLSSLESSYATASGEDVKLKKQAMPYSDAKTLYIQAKRILQNAEESLSKARMEKMIDIDPVKIRQRAERPLGADRPKVMKYLALAVAIGLIVGVSLAFFVEYLDTSVKTLEDIEKFLQLPVLAVIPKGIPMLIKVPGEHPDTEAYRILRANLEFNKPSPDAKTLTMISAGPGEGKSTTLNNLAFTCAKGGYNVLIVDADLRRPAQHHFFDTDNDVGLADYLQGKASIDAITRTSKIDNLSFIASGHLPSDTAGILNGALITQLIGKVRGQYDMIFFDSPPILGVSDGSVLASVVDMVVIVVQHRRFPRNMLQRVKQAVQQVGGATAGVVLNNVDSRHDEGYSYYNAYQDYYAPKRSERRAGPTPAPVRRPGAPAPVQVPPNRHDNGADY